MTPPALKAEIIAIGTELLMGEVVNSNAAYLSQELAQIGIDVYYHAVVGDNPPRIREIFETALRRSNILLVTGGLGPTDDDLTIAALAEMMNTPLVCDPQSETRIRQYFITRDMPMSDTNLKQALRPDDAEVIENPVGTAPGVYWDITQKVATKGWGQGVKIIAAMPGVPREMTAMWTQTVLPRLLTMQTSPSVLATRFLKFVGIGESMLAEKLRDLMAQATPTVSPYVGQAEVKIRIAVKAATQAEGMAQIEPVETEILNRVGAYCYGKDDDTLESVVGEMLLSQKLTLAVAESCTGGLVSHRLTNVPGSSAYTRLNVVTYSNIAKEKMLEIPQEVIQQHGAVSEAVAAAMAEGIGTKIQTDIGLAITGIAGPTGGSDEKPVGLAYIGLARLGETPRVKKVTVNPNYAREQIKTWFSQYALYYLRQFLLEE